MDRQSLTAPETAEAKSPEAKNPEAEDSEEFQALQYRLGMSLYKFGVSAFFKCGGFCWLRKKYKDGLDQRMGDYLGSGVPKGSIWVHAVSVGEVQPALSLIEEAKRAGGSPPCVLSTATATGREMAEKFSAIQEPSLRADKMIYNTWDVPRFVGRALDSLEPRAYVAVETERWPVTLAQLRARKIPAFLLNGRLSERSARRLLKHRDFWRGVLCCFERLMVRFDSDAEKFLRLGVPEKKIVVTGDCKIDAMFKRKAGADPKKWLHLRRFPASPLFLAGSTHNGEDEIVLEAFAEARERHPDARLIIVPRHPERALSVAETARPYGRVLLFSGLSDPAPDFDIIVVDKIGVLFELYSAVDAAFVGGSMFPGRGGQNLMEPALFEIQVTHGPHMVNFPDTGRMDALAAAQTVTDAQGLAAAWLRAADAVERERVRLASREYFASTGGAVRRSWEIIREYTR